MTVLIPRSALAAFLSGRPALLVPDDLPGQDSLAGLGLDLWRFGPWQHGLRILPGMAAPEDALVPLPGVPARLLAVVAPAGHAALAQLRAWWAAHAPGSPAVIEAADAAAALPAVLRQATTVLAAATAEAATLQQALVALRQEAEETRVALTALARSAGVSRPLEPELVLSADPLPGLSAGAQAGEVALRQPLNLMLEGVTALAVHVAQALVGPDAMLRVRLLGAESERAFGAWLVPGHALRPGWLMLDLPMPLGAVRETAVLELAALLEPDEELRFSLEDALADAPRAVQGLGVPQPPRALAVQLWTAPPGRRCVLPLHWDWETAEQALSPPGVPVTMPAEVWAAARLPERGSMVALGLGAPRPVISLAAGDEAIAVLPVVPVLGQDLLEAEVIARSASADGVEAALWLLPQGSAPGGLHDLHLNAPGAGWSGWRPLASDVPVLHIRMRLPPEAPPTLCAVLALRRALGTPGTCRLEWAELTVRRLEIGDGADAGMAEEPVEDEAEFGALRAAQ